jgi:hypothetical protein
MTRDSLGEEDKLGEEDDLGELNKLKEEGKFGEIAARIIQGIQLHAVLTVLKARDIEMSGPYRIASWPRRVPSG